MSRKKEYIESEVIEKAMNLFWKNGFETTSMQMLENEMGINKFSIYSSFGSKNGVLIESLKCYEKKLNQLINKLKSTNNGIIGIKEYFYDFLLFSKENHGSKGCLITNTANELSDTADVKIKDILQKFTSNVRQAFFDNLAHNKNKSTTILEEQADYLIIAMFGLSSASKMFSKTQIEAYINNIFISL